MSDELDYGELARRFVEAVARGADEEVTALLSDDVQQEEFPNRLLPGGITRDRASMREAGERGKTVMASQRYEVLNIVVAGAHVAPRTSPEIRPRTVSPGPGSGGMIPYVDSPVGREVASRRSVEGSVPSPAMTVVPVSPVRPGTAAGRGSWLMATWLAGVGVLSLFLALSARGLSRMVRRSQDAPERVAEECRAIAARLGVGAVRVVSSAEVTSPCLTGLWRPLLLLPERQCLVDEHADLRSILAHELAHVRGRDLAWNALLHLVSGWPARRPPTGSRWHGRRMSADGSNPCSARSTAPLSHGGWSCPRCSR